MLTCCDVYGQLVRNARLNEGAVARVRLDWIDVHDDNHIHYVLVLAFPCAIGEYYVKFRAPFMLESLLLFIPSRFIITIYLLTSTPHPTFNLRAIITYHPTSSMAMT